MLTCFFFSLVVRGSFTSFLLDLHFCSVFIRYQVCTVASLLFIFQLRFFFFYQTFFFSNALLLYCSYFVHSLVVSSLVCFVGDRYDVLSCDNLVTAFLALGGQSEQDQMRRSTR